MCVGPSRPLTVRVDAKSLGSIRTKEEVDQTIREQVASMLKKDNVQAEQLPRCKSEMRSREGLFGVPKLHTFNGRQGTTYIAQEE
jgi:hypothetical protein